LSIDDDDDDDGGGSDDGDILLLFSLLNERQQTFSHVQYLTVYIYASAANSRQ